MLEILLPIAVGTLLIGYSASRPYFREKKRDRYRNLPFKKEWRKIIQSRVPYFRKMPSDLQLQLKQHIQVFINEKEFVGCNGVKITDEIRVTIAAQACLLLLNRKTDYYPKLKTILVYPRAFLKEQSRVNGYGIQYQEKTALAGESWDYGKVVLSWEDTKDGAEITDDGRNVVIHEFAHQLDQENGPANGAPILGKNQNYKCWSEVFNYQYEKLRNNVSKGIPMLLDSYGATSPAEFFAVATETFFEQATLLNQQHPTLYTQLKLYYKVDPIHWN